MNPSLAAVVFGLGILCLFYLNCDKSVHTSRALWVPVIWLCMTGSRPLSVWLGGPTDASAATLVDGSPTDRLAFQILLVIGWTILAHRSHRAASVMSRNWPLLLYFAYCFLSIAWSDFPDVALKRWIKATGDVVMALIVVTDPQPVAALRRLFSRIGFVLLPASVLLIKYYPDLGCSFDEWSGHRYPTGVTTNKNILGLITYILTLAAFSEVLRLWRDRHLPERFRQLVAQCSLLGCGGWLLSTADSATSQACLMLGAGVLLLPELRRIRGRTAAVHALVLTGGLFGILLKLTGADHAIMQAMGRTSDLTGRVAIWPVLIPMAPSILVGAGFESFWLGSRLQALWDAFSGLHLNEAHNGYIEVYLNLGMVGVSLISVVLIHGYRRTVSAFRLDPHSGSLMLAYVLAAAMYSYTEAGFRSLNYAWSFLLLAIIGATSISQRSSHTQQPGAVSESVTWFTEDCGKGEPVRQAFNEFSESAP